ncbi:hypothetical protein VTI74DRAFT_11531 [Chaetomium olivicolor]
MAAVVDREYTAKEVAQHKDRADGWMIIHGNATLTVYDITQYISDHPGGADVLLDTMGTDATEAFDNAGHSEDATEIMATYCIGKLKGGAAQKPKAKPVRLALRPTQQEQNSDQSSSSKSSSAPVLLLGTAVTALGAWGTYLATRRGDAIWAISLPSFHFRVSDWLRFGAGAHPKNSGSGFAEGFLAATAISSVVGVVAAKTLANFLKVESGFTKYPAHLKLAKPVPQELLLQRGWLDPVTYHALPLAKKELIAPNVYRLVFTLPTPLTVLGLPIGQHVAIKATVNGQAVTRSYTPVSNNSDLGVLELVIKAYPDGLLTGGYLAKLDVGDEVLFRGPKGAMRYRRGLCRKIGMLAGGTGITPMYQLIRAICEDDRDLTEVSLIYANRTEEDILLRAELEAFARKYPRNLKIYYMLDNPPAEWAYGRGYVTQDIMAQRFPAPSEDSKVMLCGPPGMVNAAKKALVNLGFKQPGASSRMSDQIFCF